MTVLYAGAFLIFYIETSLKILGFLFKDQQDVTPPGEEVQPREERVPHGVAGLALHWPACVVFPLLCLLAPSVQAQASGLQ